MTQQSETPAPRDDTATDPRDGRCRKGHLLRFASPVAYAGPCCCGPDGDGEEPDCRPCCPTDGDHTAALPPVAGPEVRPDETLRAAVDYLVRCYAHVQDGDMSLGQSNAWKRVKAALAAPAPAPGDDELRARVAGALRSYMGDCEGLIERDVPFYADDADDLAAAVVAALASPAPAPGGGETLRAEALEALRRIVKPCRPPASFYSCNGDDDPTVGVDCSDPQCQNDSHSRRRTCTKPWHTLSPALRAALASPSPAATEVGEGER